MEIYTVKQRLLDQLISFPIFKKKNNALIRLSQGQKEAVTEYNNKINNGHYCYIKNYCLCNNKNPDNDIVFLKKDRYGILMDHILCMKCSLIRVNKILDSKSLEKFYGDDYRRIYSASERSPEKLFKIQVSRGEKIIKYLSSLNLYNSIHTVLDIGCCAGGMIYPFFSSGKEVCGCDFDHNYIDYGRSRGLKLHMGDVQSANIKKESQDLIILAHVLEHYLDPILELKNIIQYISPGGLLLIETPGIFLLHKGIFQRFFQNVHTYIFHEKYLKKILDHLNLKVIECNESIYCLAQKPKNYQYRPNTLKIENDELIRKSEEVYFYLKQSYLLHRIILNPYRIKHFTRKNFIKFIDVVGMREPVKKVKNLLISFFRRKIN